MKREYQFEENKPRYIKQQRLEGASAYYFILHNILSGILFLAIIYIYSLQTSIQDQISYLFSLEFLELLIVVWLLLMMTGIVSRIFAYLILKYYFEESRKKQFKTFGELNRGVNRMLNLSWFLSLFLGAIVFSIGLITLMQKRFFGKESILGLIIVYLIIKTIIYLVVKFTSHSKF